MKTLLLADDHTLFREGFSLLLQQFDTEVRILEACTLDAAIALARGETALDLALLDLNMPGMRGVEGLPRFREETGGVPVVVISASEDAADIRRMMDAGAVGYIPKSSSAQVMLAALRLVLAGGIYLPTEVLTDPAIRGEVGGNGSTHLTGRQLEVLHRLVQGKPNKVIARELQLSEGTVKIHLASIYRTLNAANRTEAAMAARKLGLLPDMLL